MTEPTEPTEPTATERTANESTAPGATVATAAATGVARWLDVPETFARVGGGGGFLRDPGAAILGITDGVEDAIGAELGGWRVFFVVAPELVRELLVDHAGETAKGPGVQRARSFLGDGVATSEGARHREARRKVAPACASARVAPLGAVAAGLLARRMATWSDGDLLDVRAEMSALAAELAVGWVLGARVASSPGAVDACRGVVEAFGAQTGIFGRADGAGSDPLELHDVTFETLLREVVDDPSGDAAGGGPSVAALLRDAWPAGGTDLRDELATVLVTTHGSLLAALSWTWHLLGTHPEAARRCAEEARSPVSAARGAGLRSWRAACVDEALRLYPPSWAIGRSVVEPFTLAGAALEPGTVVVASPYVIHRRARYFPEPGSYLPDRWLDPAAARAERAAYLPFGAGDRSCLGEQAALAVLDAVVAAVLGSWWFEPEGGHAVEPEFRATLCPRGALPMRARRVDSLLG